MLTMKIWQKILQKINNTQPANSSSNGSNYFLLKTPQDFMDNGHHETMRGK